MKSIILIGDESFNLEKITSIKHEKSKDIYSIIKKRVVVEFEESHIYYDEENIIEEYEEEELAKIPYKYPRFIILSYRSELLIKELFSQKNYIKGIYIDDNNGNISPIEKFIETL